MFRVLVPKVKGSVGAGGTKGAVYGVEGYVVYSVDVGDAVAGGVTMAFEGEVGGAVL